MAFQNFHHFATEKRLLAPRTARQGPSCPSAAMPDERSDSDGILEFLTHCQRSFIALLGYLPELSQDA